MANSFHCPDICHAIEEKLPIKETMAINQMNTRSIGCDNISSQVERLNWLGNGSHRVTDWGTRQHKYSMVECLVMHNKVLVVQYSKKQCLKYYSHLVL